MRQNVKQLTNILALTTYFNLMCKIHMYICLIQMNVLVHSFGSWTKQWANGYCKSHKVASIKPYFEMKSNRVHSDTPSRTYNVMCGQFKCVRYARRLMRRSSFLFFLFFSLLIYNGWNDCNKFPFAMLSTFFPCRFVFQTPI